MRKSIISEQSYGKFPNGTYAEIGKSIKEPKFRNATYNIRDFGAVADGKTMNTEFIKKAIQKCSQEGGGKAVVPRSF